MNRSTALAISVIFHPVFTNLLSLLALIWLFPYLDYGLSGAAKQFYVLFIFISTGVIPVLFVLALKAFNRNTGIMLEHKEERRLPYLLTAALYLFNFYFFDRVHAPALIRAFLLGSASIVVLLLVINHFDKISIHMASLGLLTAIVFAAAGNSTFDVRILLPPLFLLTGLTASARLFAKAHDLQQLVSGFAIGYFIMSLIL